jgi:ribosomal protein S1
MQEGDLIEVTVTKSLPFGVLVESSAGMPGLVRGVTATIGETVRVRVVSYDTDRKRFHASMA